MLQRRHTIIRSMGKTAISALLSMCIASAGQAAGRPITANDLLSMERLSEPQLSPDGTRAIYTVAVPDLAANRMARNIWLTRTWLPRMRMPPTSLLMAPPPSTAQRISPIIAKPLPL